MALNSVVSSCDTNERIVKAMNFKILYQKHTRTLNNKGQLNFTLRNNKLRPKFNKWELLFAKLYFYVNCIKLHNTHLNKK